MKKGRHRRFEEARAMKRSNDVDLDELMESLRNERGAAPGSDDDHDDSELDD